MTPTRALGLMLLLGSVVVLLNLWGTRDLIIKRWMKNEEAAPEFLRRAAGSHDPDTNFRQKRSMAWGLGISMLLSGIVLLFFVE